MKETGINYFVDQLGLDTGTFGLFYTFEDGAGPGVSSISGGQAPYSGVLSSVGGFWDSPGSGHFTGQTLAVANASGLDSVTWTKVFVYEKVNTDDCLLFSSLGGNSGCKIGLTRANRLYFETLNVEPIVAASSNNLSSKNAVVVSYLPNLVTLGLYDFNAQALEVESFNYPFQLARSDDWRIGGQFTGFLDYHLHLTTYLSPSVAGQLLSGLYARPTGIGFLTQIVCTTGITGYQATFVGQTGVTGYIVLPSGDEGRDFYTGAFPLSYTQTALTGYLSTGIAQIGLTGVSCLTVTGAEIDLLEYLTGYAAGFGMQKLQLFPYIDGSDLVKAGWSRTPFDDIYNRVGQRSYSGYLLASDYPTGRINLFYNGIAQANTGWAMTGSYLILSGADAADVAILDLKSGSQQSFSVTGGLTGFAFAYSGQEVFLNGVNLVSGRDFVLNAGTFNLFGPATGISGYVFEYPIVLSYQTGSSNLLTGLRFQRDTSAVYLNGVRQQNRASYIEGATFDLLSGDFFNPSGVTNVYDDNDLFWEN